MKRNTHTTIYFAIALLAFLALGGGYWSVYTSIDGQTLRTTNILKEVAKEQSRKVHQKSLEALLEGIHSDRTKLLGYFVPGDQVIDFIKQVEEIGPATGSTVSIISINADDLSESAPESVGRVRAHVSGLGSWSSVAKAVMLAEQLPYSVSVNNLRLDSVGISDLDGKSLPSPKWRIEFDIEILSIK